MKLENLNGWLDEAERLLMFLPDTEGAEIAGDLVEFAIERIRNATLDSAMTMQQILNLKEKIRSALRNFEFFI